MAESSPYELQGVKIADLVRDIAAGIADAQKALDQASLAMVKQIETDKDFLALKNIGYQPTWYVIPEATAEVKVTFHLEKEMKAGKRGFFLLPFNAKEQTTTKFREEGVSQLKLRIVPTPPPANADSTTRIPD